MRPSTVAEVTRSNSSLTLLLAGALAGVAIHLVSWRGYGWFRDEFYYFACAAHLDYGYVDHPALSIVLLWVIHHTIGDSLFAIRFVAAIVSGAVILVTGLMARSLGAGWFGQTLAMLCALVAPVYLALGSFYSMNVFDLLVWALAGWIVIELLKTPRMSLWIALGVLLGLGFENKISALWLCGGLALGLILTPQRRAAADVRPVDCSPHRRSIVRAVYRVADATSLVHPGVHSASLR